MLARAQAVFGQDQGLYVSNTRHCRAPGQNPIHDLVEDALQGWQGGDEDSWSGQRLSDAAQQASLPASRLAAHAFHPTCGVHHMLSVQRLLLHNH